jgi:hypothetical protein
MDCDRGCRVDVRCRVLEPAGGLGSSFLTTMAGATEASCLSTTKWDERSREHPPAAAARNAVSNELTKQRMGWAGNWVGQAKPNRDPGNKSIRK